MSIERRPWLLAIDTSSEQAAIALFDGLRLAELSWPAGRNQTVSGLAAIDQLFQMVGAGPTDLGAVAIATGPGMFSGLRVGMSLAKGFVLGVDAVLVGVSSFEITMYPWRSLRLPITGVIPAGRERLLWASAAGDGLLGDPTNGDIEGLAAAITARGERSLIVGEMSEAQRERLATVANAVLSPAASSRRRAGSLAEIGWARLLAGELDDPVLLEPTYVHTGRASVPA